LDRVRRVPKATTGTGGLSRSIVPIPSYLRGQRILETTIGERIVKTRLARGYPNAAAFARKIGFDKQYLWNLETDKVFKPDPVRLVIIAKALHVSLEWLITGEGDPLTSYIFNKNQLGVIELLKVLSEDSLGELRECAKYLYDKQLPND
jgi:transcriptional regulator with XRE-family HTH domain